MHIFQVIFYFFYSLAAKLFVVSTDLSLDCKLALSGYKWSVRYLSRHLPHSLATSLELAPVPRLLPEMCKYFGNPRNKLMWKEHSCVFLVSGQRNYATETGATAAIDKSDTH